MTELDIAQEIRWILGSLGDKLPGVDRDNISRYVDYGEYAIAIETLCDQMGEREVVPTRPIYDKIMTLVSALRIATQYRSAIPAPPET